MRKRPWDRESWRGELAGWCWRWLGADPVDELFVVGWQSAVVGVELSDGRRVVVKIRRPAARLTTCYQVQEHLWRTGFCCPRPLRAPTRLGPFVATAEEFVGGGTELPDPTAHVEELAGVLADLVGKASHLPIRSSLAPAPDWAGWNQTGTGIWPDSGADEVDLNHTPEPGWLTELVTGLGRHARHPAPADCRTRRLGDPEPVLDRGSHRVRVRLGQRLRSARGRDRRAGRDRVPGPR